MGARGAWGPGGFGEFEGVEVLGPGCCNARSRYDHTNATDLYWDGTGPELREDTGAPVRS